MHSLDCVFIWWYSNLNASKNKSRHPHIYSITQLIYYFLSDRPVYKVYLRPDCTLLFAVCSGDNYVCSLLISFHSHNYCSCVLCANHSYLFKSIYLQCRANAERILKSQSLCCNWAVRSCACIYIFS